VSWDANPPQLYDIITGFFPEANPKQTWADNPRPLLCCGVARDPETRVWFVRVAFGTTQNLSKAHPSDLVIGNLTMLNGLCLVKPTRFVINSGDRMVILPWTEEFFRPWAARRTPILSKLPLDMQRYVGNTLARLENLPPF
jgi:hypothetical protein